MPSSEGAVQKALWLSRKCMFTLGSTNRHTQEAIFLKGGDQSGTDKPGLGAESYRCAVRWSSRRRAAAPGWLLPAGWGHWMPRNRKRVLSSRPDITTRMFQGPVEGGAVAISRNSAGKKKKAPRAIAPVPGPGWGWLSCEFPRVGTDAGLCMLRF